MFPGNLKWCWGSRAHPSLRGLDYVSIQVLKMSTRRRRLPLDIKQIILHESGFQCANPNCRHTLTLDIHHLDSISDGGTNDPQNLIALCPNCHAGFHRGDIPKASIRAWKLLAVSLSEGLGRRAVEVLLALDKTGPLMIDGDGVLTVASLIASDLVALQSNTKRGGLWGSQTGLPAYELKLTPKGQIVVRGWKEGNQNQVVDVGAGVCADEGSASFEKPPGLRD